MCTGGEYRFTEDLIELNLPQPKIGSLVPKNKYRSKQYGPLQLDGLDNFETRRLVSMY